jgi:hypothetical protein
MTHAYGGGCKNELTQLMTFLTLQVSNSVKAKFYFSMFGDNAQFCLGLVDA